MLRTAFHVGRCVVLISVSAFAQTKINNTERVVVSFKAAAPVAEQRLRILRLLADKEFREIKHWPNLPAIYLEAKPSVLALLASSADVGHIDRDIEGTGITSRLEGLSTASRVAVLDAGLFSGSVTSESIDETCFCLQANGRGCCPDGSSEQTGPGSAASTAHTSTSTELVANRPTLRPEHAPERHRILAVKVLDDANHFSSLVPILSAVDWLLSNEPDTQTVVLAFATQELFCAGCADQNANMQTLSRGLTSLRARGVSIYAPGISAPACLQAIHSVPVTGNFLGQIPGPVRLSASPAPAAPIAPNSTTVIALVDSEAPIPEPAVLDELPSARTSLKLHIIEAVATSAAGLNLLSAPAEIQAYSLTPLSTSLGGQQVKAVLTLAGSSSNSHWWVEQLHPIPCKETQ